MTSRRRHGVVNAIAKQLGVSGPALYRYFAKRDDLLTALIVDAYSDLHDALAAAADKRPEPRTTGAQLARLAHAYRAWAVAEPHRYELLFKAPLPRYDAHRESLAAASRSLMVVLLGVLPGPQGADRVPTGRRRMSTKEVLAAREAGAPNFHLAVTVWSRLHGFVSLEIGGSFSAMQLNADALFEDEVGALERLIDVRRRGAPSQR